MHFSPRTDQSPVLQVLARVDGDARKRVERAGGAEEGGIPFRNEYARRVWVESWEDRVVGAGRKNGQPEQSNDLK